MAPPTAAGDVLVTAVTPTWRRDPAVVRRCAQCMQLQTEPRWEQLICSDGADEPAIRQVVAELNDPRVSYRHTAERRAGDYGGGVRNAMLGLARGRYVFFFDDDNVILPRYVRRMVRAVEAAGADFAVCRVVHFGPLNEGAVGKPPQVLTGVPVKVYHIDTLQVLARTDAMRAVGWDAARGYQGDGATFERLAAHAGGRYAVVPEVLGFHL